MDYNYREIVIGMGDAMVDYGSYVAGENVERFEALLRSGRLDLRQVETVTGLLAQARVELERLNRRRAPEAMAERRGGGVLAA